jgi:putative membrane protein
VHWLLSAVCLLLVAWAVPGILVTGLGTALIAAVVIGLVNGTLGTPLKLLTFPLSVLTFGIFWLVINALMLKLAAAFVPGFEVRGFWPAFWGGVILSLLNLIVRHLLWRRTDCPPIGDMIPNGWPSHLLLIPFLGRNPVPAMIDS